MCAWKQIAVGSIKSVRAKRPAIPASRDNVFVVSRRNWRGNIWSGPVSDDVFIEGAVRRTAVSMVSGGAERSTASKGTTKEVGEEFG